MMAAQRHTGNGIPLQQLLAGFVPAGSLPELTVTGLSLDSRSIRPGELFLACTGTVRHGVHFIEDAIANGAIAVALEPTPETAGMECSEFSVPVIVVERLQWVAGEIASRFFGEPSKLLKVVGITGTNGKTSVSQFVAQAISRDTACGVVGTLGSGLYGRLDATGHTTPDAVSLQRQLAQMVVSGASLVAMEVSSHALDQGRVNGVQFDVAVFTNLSHEHLDYHGNMLDYANAKRRLLEMPGLSRAVINADDALGREWLQNMPAGLDEVFSYSLEGHEGATLRGEQLQLDASGLSLQILAGERNGLLRTGLLGRFNASNLLAAFGVMLALGYGFDDAMSRLTGVTTVPGRMEAFGGREHPLVVVDYAHTPDALSNVLGALREHCRGELWCIFGCGGERDRQKRPMMGKIAEQLADSVVITDDNPRREDPYNIIEDILRGIEKPDAVYIHRNRPLAIASAIELAHEGDVILVAGKGHESEQLIGDKAVHYSDREEVARLLGEEMSHG